MSRHIQNNATYEIAYGHDHIVGLFVQVFTNERTSEDDDGLIIDLDQTKDGLTGERMVEIAEEYGFIIQGPESIID